MNETISGHTHPPLFHTSGRKGEKGLATLLHSHPSLIHPSGYEGSRVVVVSRKPAGGAVSSLVMDVVAGWRRMDPFSVARDPDVRWRDCDCPHSSMYVCMYVDVVSVPVTSPSLPFLSSPSLPSPACLALPAYSRFLSCTDSLSSPQSRLLISIVPVSRLPSPTPQHPSYDDLLPELPLLRWRSITSLLRSHLLNVVLIYDRTPPPTPLPSLPPPL